jgi:uncharacterized protein YbjT (DUF2867 family)
VTILIVGGTGNTGRPTAQALVARGEQVRVLARSKDKAAMLPSGVELVVGNLETGAGLQAAFAGVRRLILITANGPTEDLRGITAVTAAKDAGVERIVFLSVQDPLVEPAVEHFRTKARIEDSIRSSGADFVIVRPNSFFQGDQSVGRVMLQQGIYPMPLGPIGQNRIDTRDIADAMTRAVAGPWDLGNDCALDGPETLNGDQVAAIYSKYLGRPVVYGGNDLQKWAAGLNGLIPDWLIQSLVRMFEHVHARGMLGTPESIARTERAIGHPLRTFDAYARELSSLLKGS